MEIGTFTNTFMKYLLFLLLAVPVHGASLTNSYFKNIISSGFLTLSGLTNQITDDGTNVLYNGVAIGGAGEIVTNSVVNSGTPTSGSVPKYTDATGTNIQPSKVTLTSPETGSTITVLDGKTLTANKSITLDGTDGTTMTFPTTSATIARTDASNMFTGTQNFDSLVSTTLDTGQGANELYDMDQNVLTTSSPQFVRLTLNGSTAANPAIKRDTDTDTGLLWPGTGQVGFASDGKQVMSVKYRLINGVDDNAYFELGNRPPIVNEANQTYVATVAVGSVEQSGDSQFIGFNMGVATLTAQDTVTKAGQMANIEFDKLDIFQVMSNAVTYSDVVNSRFRFAIPHDGVYIEDSKGIDFTIPNPPNGTVGTYCAINIPSMTGGGGTNFTGIRFSNSPNLGSLSSTSNNDVTIIPGGTGKVGIGTTSPSVMLDVNGSAKVKGFQAALVTKTNSDSPYTALSTDYTILCDATSGTITINLPAAASHSGRIFNVKKSDSSVNAVTIDGNASETIDGSTTQVLSVQYHALTIQSDGSNWHIL